MGCVGYVGYVGYGLCGLQAAWAVGFVGYRLRGPRASWATWASSFCGNLVYLLRLCGIRTDQSQHRTLFTATTVTHYG